MAEPDSKTCVKCGETKPLCDFRKRPRNRLGVSTACLHCVRALDRAYQAKSYAATKRVAKPPKPRAKRTPKETADWYAQRRRDPEYLEWRRQWRLTNLAVVNETNQRRRMAAKQAQPAWASREDIVQVYEFAAVLSRETGVEYHVDHVVPLRSKFVCGFHCEDNFAVITAYANKSKNNLWWPDMWLP